MEKTGQSIEDMDIIKQLTELLESQNMQGQSQDFMALFQYAAGMQVQLALMAEELYGVKEQLARLQAAGVQSSKPQAMKADLTKKMEGLETHISQLSKRLSAIKDHLIETAKQAVNAWKEKGREGLNRVLRTGVSGVKNLLQDYRGKLVETLTDYEKTANQIDSIGDELKQIGNSFVNVGRLLTGKGTQEVSDEKTGVALTRAVNASIKKRISGLQSSLGQVDRMTEKLDQFSARLENGKEPEKGRISVKEKLSEMKEKSGQQKKSQETSKEKNKEAGLSM